MPTDKQANATTAPKIKVVTRSMASSKCTTLLQMPTEVLINIVKSIGVEDIGEGLKAVTRFAMTSKQSLIIAEAAVGSLKRLRSLEKRFGKPCFDVFGPKYALSWREDFREMFPNLSPKSPAPKLAYLNLNGSLSWLPPLDSVLEYPDEIESYCQETIMKEKSLNKLIAQAESLHLKFPPSFLTLAKSKDLQRRIPSSDQTHVSIGSLIRCSPETDRNAGGYVLSFLSGYKESWTANLYLDTMGQHCVLHSGEDLYPEDSDEDGDEGEGEDKEEVWKDDAVTLQALDFEEYMYHTWISEYMYHTIDELGWETLPTSKRVCEAQRAYLGRIQQS